MSNSTEFQPVITVRMEYRPSRVNLAAVVAQNLGLLAANATSKKITVSNNVPPTIFVWADDYMMQTIIRNLVSNALKFTPRQGNIQVNVGPVAY